MSDIFGFKQIAPSDYPHFMENTIELVEHAVEIYHALVITAEDAAASDFEGGELPSIKAFVVKELYKLARQKHRNISDLSVRELLEAIKRFEQEYLELLDLSRIPF